MTSLAPLESRLDELFAVIDRMDADAFNAFLAPDAMFRFEGEAKEEAPPGGGAQVQGRVWGGLHMPYTQTLARPRFRFL